MDLTQKTIHNKFFEATRAKVIKKEEKVLEALGTENIFNN